MIQDLSLSLRGMLTRDGHGFAELAAAQITFDRPSDGYNPAQPSVSLYLYDVRENLELRDNTPVRSVAGATATLGPPPLRLACTYLVTAWAGNVTGDELSMREQRLLSQVVQVVARNPVLPGTDLANSLAGQDPPVPLAMARGDGLRSPSEFWTALSNRLRPSIGLTATISVPTFAATTATVVTGSELRLNSGGKPVADRFRIAGRVTDPTGKPVVGAAVGIAALGLSTTTAGDGAYVLGPLPKGDTVIHVQVGAIGHDSFVHVPAITRGGYDVKLT